MKAKYGDAKRLGEYAQSIRNEMSIMISITLENIKERLSEETQDSSMREQLANLVVKYKSSYEKLKDLKSEIEHLQHLLEQGRIRMTRDFEAWYVEVYQVNEQLYPSHIIAGEREFTPEKEPRLAWSPEESSTINQIQGRIPTPNKSLSNMKLSASDSETTIGLI